MKWIFAPSISVTNCGNVLQPRRHAPEVVPVQPVARQRFRDRELHTLRPLLDQFLLGQRVPAIRRRRSAICSSGNSTVNGRMSVALVVPVVVTLISPISLAR